MSQKNISQKQNPQGTPQPTSATPMSQEEIDFVPSPDEVSRRAYFAFENQGSLKGQHWLKAEADLITEHELTRTHQFHNRT
jgi:hypothetical protein